MSLGPPSRRQAVRLSLRPHTRRLALSRCCWAQGIVGGLFAWLLPHRWPTRRSALRFVVGLFVLPLSLRARRRALSCPRYRRSALRVVIGPFCGVGVVLRPLVLSFSLRCRGLACCVVISPTLPSFRPAVSSFGRSWCRLALCVVLPLLVLSRGPPCRRSAFPGCWSCPKRRLGGSVGEGRKEEGQERATTKVVAHSRDALFGPPISWVPLLVTPSPRRFPPHSGPTSLRRGERHQGLELRGWERAGAGRRWWWWWEEGRMNQHPRLMRLMSN
jgi:hypothetical protein